MKRINSFCPSSKSLLIFRFVSSPPLSQKYFTSHFCKSEVELHLSRAHTRGRFAIVTMRWVGDAMDAAASGGFIHAGRKRRSVRRSRVVLAPRPWRYLREFIPALRGKKGRFPGRARISRKATARGKRSGKKPIQINAVWSMCRYLCRDPRKPRICCAKRPSSSAGRTVGPPKLARPR